MKPCNCMKCAPIGEQCRSGECTKDQTIEYEVLLERLRIAEADAERYKQEWLKQLFLCAEAIDDRDRWIARVKKLEAKLDVIRGEVR